MGGRYKTILTGTPVTQGMQDLYSQMYFLDPNIIGSKSYFTFKARYCVMGGFEGRQIIGYTNQEELLDKIAPHSIMIKKTEMMDLPDKTYEKLYVDPTKDQKKALKELGDPFEMATVVDDKMLEVETILERMTRYQQIVGGHFPFDQVDGTHGIMPFPGKNPKAEALVEFIEDLPQETKVIIWARFVPEIDLIADALAPLGGVVTYTGATPADDRKRILQQFQEDPHTRFFVSNPSMGGIGITLTAASVAVYYSNTFSLEDRLQSEGRNHRKGQVNKVTYVDIIMNHDIDQAIVTALHKKQSIADYVDERLQDQ
jgi:SNF2 family DNA or RNA helicase